MRSEGTHQHGSTLRDDLRVVKRRRWIIPQAVIQVPLAAVLSSLRQEKMYQASAEVLLSQQPDRVAQTQADLARVPEVARGTLDYGSYPQGQATSRAPVA